VSSIADLNALAIEIADQLRNLPKHDAATLRALRRRVSAELVAQPAKSIVRIAKRIMQSGVPGRHVIACELILHRPDALATIRAKDLEHLGRFMANWAEVDTFACYVAGRAWRARQIEDSVVLGWAGSDNRWWRRAALVSTVPLNVRAQGGSGDARRTLRICRLLVADRDPMVVKAMSWALRELAVRDAAAVSTFLQRQDERLAPQVRREVRSKLETGRKAAHHARKQ
jgi:3-methyladenine DNA glycosylase AlkD